MVFDVVRGYLQVAGGLTDVTLQRARDLAETVMSSSGEAAERGTEQVSALAEDLVKQSQTNREILVGLIRTEIDRTVGRMGFVREEELAAVRNHVQRLEAQVKALQGGASNVGSAAVRTIGGAADKATKVVPINRSETPARTHEAAQAKAPAKKAQVKPAPAKKSTPAAKKSAVAKKTAPHPAPERDDG